MPSTKSIVVSDGLGLLDRDDAVLADLLHGVGDLLADLGVVVGGDGGDVGDLLFFLDLLGGLLDLLHGDGDRRRRCRA